jgi:hypothetical protein
MSVDCSILWPEQADEPDIRIDGRIDPRLEDAYWQSVYWAEPYHRGELDYEDYAPAYCAGYIGFAQYGGSFDDAEKSLCANWLRIKGDSRLSLDEALLAMRAAWAHARQGQVEAGEEPEAACNVHVIERPRAASRPLGRPQPVPQPAYAAV